MAADRARLAPSVQNSQPWEFRLHPDRLELWLDARRRPPALDPDGRESLLSLGAALFNARVGIASVRQAADVQRFPDPHRGHLAAVVRPAEGGPDPALAALAPLVELRHSTRSGYAGPPLPEAVADLVGAAAAEGAVLVPVLPGEVLPRLGVRPGRDGDDARFVLATADDGPLGRLRAGEALERVLLEAVRLGCQAAVVSVHPDRRSSGPGRSAPLPAGLHPQVVVRTGRAEPGPGSPRRRSIDVLRDLTMYPPSERERWTTDPGVPASPPTAGASGPEAGGPRPLTPPGTDGRRWSTGSAGRSVDAGPGGHMATRARR
jgi:hypothetical protein